LFWGHLRALEGVSGLRRPPRPPRFAPAVPQACHVELKPPVGLLAVCEAESVVSVKCGPLSARVPRPAPAARRCAHGSIVRGRIRSMRYGPELAGGRYWNYASEEEHGMFNCTRCNVVSSHLGSIVRHQVATDHSGIEFSGLEMRRAFPAGDGEALDYLAELEDAERRAEGVSA